MAMIRVYVDVAKLEAAGRLKVRPTGIRAIVLKELDDLEIVLSRETNGAYYCSFSTEGELPPDGLKPFTDHVTIKPLVRIVDLVRLGIKHTCQIVTKSGLAKAGIRFLSNGLDADVFIEGKSVHAAMAMYRRLLYGPTLTLVDESTEKRQQTTARTRRQSGCRSGDQTLEG